MKGTADIVIIGGGISGVSTGYFLLKNGAKNVVILERNYLTSGATGRCGAGIRQQWGSEINCVLSKFSCEFFENADYELKFPGGIEFHQGGYLMLISTEKELEQTKKNVRLQNSLGINSRMLDVNEAKVIAPLIDANILLGAAYYEKDGHLNPFRTTLAFAEAFKKLGGEIYTGVNVNEIFKAKNRVSGVGTNKGDISAPVVVSCVAGYTQQIAKMAGVTIPVYSERHNILVTEPVESALTTMLMGFSLNFYCQQTPDHGSFIMGRTCKNQPTDLRVTSDSSFLEEMSKTIIKVMPKLKDLRILRQWAGLYNMSPDKHQICDEFKELPGLYVAAGFSGHGFMMSPATGVSMAEMILGLPATLPWDKLGLRRFEDGGELLVEPSVV